MIRCHFSNDSVAYLFASQIKEYLLYAVQQIFRQWKSCIYFLCDSNNVKFWYMLTANSNTDVSVENSSRMNIYWLFPLNGVAKYLIFYVCWRYLIDLESLVPALVQSWEEALILIWPRNGEPFPPFHIPNTPL